MYMMRCSFYYFQFVHLCGAYTCIPVYLYSVVLFIAIAYCKDSLGQRARELESGQRQALF